MSLNNEFYSPALGPINVSTPDARLIGNTILGKVTHGSATSSGTSISIGDTLAGYQTSAFVGDIVKILSTATGVLYQSSVSANSSQTISFDSLPGGYVPAVGDLYNIIP
jgi:hypothetical protein